MAAQLTIGIPTFNRAHFLPESLGAALAQSLPDIEVIVSDNASTDGTEALVRSTADRRVKYFRQASNVGAVRNCQALLDLASADCFCLLQDDDMIFPDLARRAHSALKENPEASWYASYALSRTDIGLGYNACLYGPPFRLDWRAGRHRSVNGDLLLPLCLVCTPAIPPVTVFRTAQLRQAFAQARTDDCPLFCERLWVARASHGSQVIVDPYVGGWFRCHPGQANVAMLRERRASREQWQFMREEIAALVDADLDSVSACFADYLGEVPRPTIVMWDSILRQARRRTAFDRRVLAVLSDFGGRVNNGSALRSALKSLTPPLLWDLMRLAQSWLRRSVGPGSGP